MAESQTSGALAQCHHQDAFGNANDSFASGSWGGDRGGWHHNTKEFDVDTGLVYMYHRWYLPESSGFASNAPYPTFLEHPFTFALQRPTSIFDPTGEISIGEAGCAVAVGVENGVTGFVSGAINDLSFGIAPPLHDTTNPDQHFGATTGRLTGGVIGALAMGNGARIGYQAGIHRAEKALLGEMAARQSAHYSAYGFSSGLGFAGGAIPTRAALAIGFGQATGGAGLVIGAASPAPAAGGVNGSVGTGAPGFWGRTLGCP